MHARQLELFVDAMVGEGFSGGAATINMGGVMEFDTYGAWLLERFVRTWEARGSELRVLDLPVRFSGLLTEVHATNRQPRPWAVVGPKWPVVAAVVAYLLLAEAAKRLYLLRAREGRFAW
jgi:hypothetical protein